MPRHLSGKVAAVTGAGRGIGRGIAERLAMEGAKIVVADYGGAVDTGVSKREAVADEVADAIRSAGGEAVAITEDVSTMPGGQRIVEAAVNAFGRLDAMVCCAGVLAESGVTELNASEWDRTISVHLRGHFSCIQAATRQMIKQGEGGRLLFFSSSTALAGSGDRPAYAAAKAGVMGFSYSCAEELAGYGITSNCIVPRAATRMTDAALLAAGALDDGPLPSERDRGSVLDPTNVAPMVAYLLTDMASGINGQVFGIVGSQVARLAPASWTTTLQGDAPWVLDDLVEEIPKVFGTELGYKAFEWERPRA
jgi:NAD(P)-dependent dehydrogenase (short-subunit alcohol dehydrogenase family)